MMEPHQVREMLALAITGLVDQPGEVLLETIETPASIIFRVRATPSDVSMLVGKNGRMARALRTLLTGMRRPESRPYLLDIVQ